MSKALLYMVYSLMYRQHSKKRYRLVQWYRLYSLYIHVVHTHTHTYIYVYISYFRFYFSLFYAVMADEVVMQASQWHMNM